MCGIIGVVALGDLKSKKAEEMRQEAMRLIATKLLFVTQERGKDATGISTMFNDGNYMILKMGIASPEFVTRWGGTETDYNGYIKAWEQYVKPAKICIGHCRKASIGDVYNNANNHPIKAGEIIGVHNGTLKNHHRIFRLLDIKQDGEVDSEAIMRLIQHFAEDGLRPFTIDMAQEICRRIEGGYAVISYSGNNPHQLLTFRDGRPLEMVLVRPLNIIILASEKKFINHALYGWNENAELFGYNKHRGWPVIKAEDLDWAIMQDRTISIYDLRMTVEQRMSQKEKQVIKIDDFIDDAKIPISDKLWEVGTATTTHYGRYSTPTDNDWQNRHNANASAVNVPATPQPPSVQALGTATAKTEVNVTSVVKDDKKENVEKKPAKSTNGRIFCRALKTYTSTLDISTEDLQNVEIALEDDAVITHSMSEEEISIKDISKNKADADLEKDDDIKLVDVTENPPSELIDNPVPINKIEVSRVEDTKIKTIGEIGNQENTIEVDMTVDPRALEMAEIATRGVVRYENKQEVADELETNQASIDALPLHGLANRLKSIFFKTGFVAGFKEGVKCVSPDVTPTKLDKTALRQRKNIHILKSFTKTLARILDNNVSDRKIVDSVTETLRVGDKLESEPLDRIFSVGDHRDPRTKIISRVIDHLKVRENRGG